MPPEYIQMPLEYIQMPLEYIARCGIYAHCMRMRNVAVLRSFDPSVFVRRDMLCVSCLSSLSRMSFSLVVSFSNTHADHLLPHAHRAAALTPYLYTCAALLYATQDPCALRAEQPAR